ncbi:MAG: HAMP domain-containing protein [Acidobacteria bacterium]|nr:HAMP domain-containing protein [Acidobacteriota bacterium]
MRLGIKGKQVLGVTSIVGVVVVVLSVLQLAELASVSLEESRARAELLANAVYQRAREVVSVGGDPYDALRRDPGLRSILESSAYSKHVTFAAIIDVRGVAVAHADAALEGRALPGGEDIAPLLGRSAVAQLAAVYRGPGRTLEWRQPLLLGDTEFGSIRVGISTLLIRADLDTSLRPALWTALAALAIAVIGAMLLAQILLRPIHVIASGLTRLGRGEFGVRLDLDPRDEFGEIGAHFNAVSDQLLADRSGAAPLDPASQEQAAVRYARKLTALGRLSAGVAHEVKNPLNAMTIHLELLRQQLAAAGDAGAPARVHADVIANEIRRLDEVVQSFLKFARPEDLKLERVRLAPLLDEVRTVVQPEAERRGVTIAIDGRAAPDVTGDPTLLRQAFLNLALNACQAMPQGGTLRIRCEARRDRKAAVAFADTGVGIQPEHLQRIFDLYFTTKEKGSGIGLSMVYRTVQMHDGEIEVESTPGVGTTFTVLLPEA